MKKYKIICYLIIAPVILFFLFWLLQAYGGWYGYQKWRNRAKTASVAKSKSRKVFVKTLQYEIIDAENLYDFTFTPYLEKGFKVGLHTSEETNIIKKSEFPFNLSYDRNKNDSIALKIMNIEDADSADVVWAYFKNTELHDTMIIKIDGARNRNGKFISGKIRVW
nr:hypothetical protein [uncultured Chryseobacterium sp.]